MFDEKDMILETRNLTKEFPASNNRSLVACNDISLKFYRGKTLGIVGESGCGKSTFMKMLVQLEKPTSGEMLFLNEDISKLKGEELRQSRRHVQMVFQDPSSAFNPKMKIVDIICEPILNYKLINKSKKMEIAKKYLKLVGLSEDFANRYPHNMSGGQRQRVGIARALTLKPDIMICDEATSALDVSIQKTIMELLAQLQKRTNISIGFICHDMALVSQISHQVAVMYLGNIVELIPGNKLHQEAKHPYTKALMKSIFDLNMDYTQKIDNLQGEVPSPLDAPAGCPLQSRCDYCMDICKQEKAPLKEVEADHYVACYLEEANNKIDTNEKIKAMRVS